jgi:hypothetical protein
MTLGDVAADIGAVVIATCLLSIVLFFLLSAGASVLTIARARSRARHRPELPAGLASGCTVSDLAEIDYQLRQVLRQEHWTHSAWVSQSP